MCSSVVASASHSTSLNDFQLNGNDKSNNFIDPGSLIPDDSPQLIGFNPSSYIKSADNGNSTANETTNESIESISDTCFIIFNVFCFIFIVAVLIYIVCKSG